MGEKNKPALSLPHQRKQTKKNWLINVRLINKRIGRVIKGKIMGLAPNKMEIFRRLLRNEIKWMLMGLKQRF